MIFAEDIYKVLKKNNIKFFTGVPDSVLKNLSSKFKKNHISVNNEGTAVSLAIGYYLSTKNLPCIYMQNSGLGNAINPLISIAHKDVYSIPSVLIIGWRGSPNSKDEPQHIAKGKITKKLLNLIGIKFCILRKKSDLKKFEVLIKFSKKHKKSVACLIEKGLITQKSTTKTKKKISNSFQIKRYEFILNLAKEINVRSKIISSTGFISRELDHVLKSNKYNLIKPFYMVGGMGHSSAVTAGLSLNSKVQNICIDGDGALLMHLGSMGINAKYGGNRFKHILLRNNTHESVGDQTTNSDHIDFKKLSNSLGYKSYYKIYNLIGYKKILKNFLNEKKPTFLEVRIKSGSIKNLSRPKNLKLIKENFMKEY